MLFCRKRRFLIPGCRRFFFTCWMQYMLLIDILPSRIFDLHFNDVFQIRICISLHTSIKMYDIIDYLHISIISIHLISYRKRNIFREGKLRIKYQHSTILFLIFFAITRCLFFAKHTYYHVLYDSSLLNVNLYKVCFIVSRPDARSFVILNVQQYNIFIRGYGLSFKLIILKQMNIDWDQQLAEYFHPKYIKNHRKVASTVYAITTLEGVEVVFDCSIEGYSCRCHQKKYELPMGLLKEHSKQYVKAFNLQLNMKLQALADLENSEDTDK